MELWGEVVGFWVYSKGRAKRICQQIRCGVYEREGERVSTIKADSKGFGPEKLERWNCYILMWMGKMGIKKLEGYIRSSVLEYEV